MVRRGFRIFHYTGLCYCFCLTLASSAFAELSVSAMAGLAEYTTAFSGHTIINGDYFSYGDTLHTNHASGGITGRYLWNMFHPRFALGVESGYVFLAESASRTFYFNGTDATNQSLSHGIILANAVGRWTLEPTVGFAIFAGPAWLNTQYRFISGLLPSPEATTSVYQPTADTGVEINWLFKRNWAIAARFDYIFNTSQRTLFMDRLEDSRADAQSGVTLVSATLRYTFPDWHTWLPQRDT